MERKHKILNIPAFKSLLVIDERYHRLIDHTLMLPFYCAEFLIFSSKAILDQSEHGNNKKHNLFETQNIVTSKLN